MSVATVYGAILLGTCVGCSLTGIVVAQIVIYFKRFPSDSVYIKSLVLAVGALDMMHTVLIISSVWESLIVNFDKPELMDLIPTALGPSVVLTAAVTFFVHCFFINRARKLSNMWYIVPPVALLAFLRLFCACVSTAELMRLGNYSSFIKPFPSWVFTLGVALSASVEFVITMIMVMFLHRSRSSFSSAITIVTLVCWLVMPNNLIFLGVHFTISKLYANSLLASLHRRSPILSPSVVGLNTLTQVHVATTYDEYRDPTKDHF